MLLNLHMINPALGIPSKLHSISLLLHIKFSGQKLFSVPGVPTLVTGVTEVNSKSVASVVMKTKTVAMYLLAKVLVQSLSTHDHGLNSVPV
jgi:hypothetical protein